MRFAEIKKCVESHRITVDCVKHPAFSEYGYPPSLVYNHPLEKEDHNRDL